MDRRGLAGEDIPDSYFRLPEDSHAAIERGDQEATPAKHVISDPTPARTGGENCLSDFCRNTDTPSTQLRMVSEARAESVIIPESTQASDDGALLHLGKQTNHAYRTSNA